MSKDTKQLECEDLTIVQQFKMYCRLDNNTPIKEGVAKALKFYMIHNPIKNNPFLPDFVKKLGKSN